MRLHHQLWLVSLLVLVLPWAGCQFVKETELAMLEVQQETLMATARAVAMRLADDSSFALSANSGSVDDRPIYFHALSEAPVIDGFDEEWRYFKHEPLNLMISGNTQTESGGETASVHGGVFRGVYYVFLNVPDSTLDNANPALHPLTSGDHLRIIRDDEADLFISASAPGNVSARYLENSQIRTEYGISGVWNHTGAGYLIELRIRPRLLESTLGLEFVRLNQSSEADEFQIGLAGSESLAFINADAALSNSLEVFSREGLRLSVIDTQGWLLATAGSISANMNGYAGHGFLTRLYRIILRDPDIEILPNWQNLGRLYAADAAQALSGQSSTAIFSQNDRKVGRSSVPIEAGGDVIGIVVAEQASESLTTSTNTAFNRLLFWTLMSMLMVGIGLLLFAALLSLRVRRLSNAADQALDEQGNFAEEFPVSRFPDEIGDLSRSYEQLLVRLRDYTSYLKTLSGKLSHELKTPLAVVRSSLDNLEQQSLPSEAQVYLERASDGTTRLSAIFSALSGASRLEDIVRNAEFERTNLSELVQAVYNSYEDAYPDTRFDIVLNAEQAPLYIQASAELIVQMLDKLVDNAVGFCREDGLVTLTLDKNRQGSQALLSVSNEGELLPEGMKAQLFDSLVSVRSQKSDQFHLGLGLYVAQLIAESHGGTVSLNNLPDDSGVQAMVSLPLFG